MSLSLSQPRTTVADLVTGDSWRTWLILAALAVTVQAMFLLETADALAFRYPLIDATSYYNQALGILAGQGRTGAFWQPPGYPYFLAGLCRLFGSDYAAVRSMQALLLAPAVTLLLWRIGRRLLVPGWAFAAAVASCFIGPLLFYQSQLLAVAPATVLVTGSLLLTLRAMAQPSTGRWLAAGAANGLAMLFVATTVALLPVLLLFAWRPTAALSRRLRAGHAAAVLAGLLAITAPVAIRNHAACGRWVWISANSGTNLYIGNSRNWESALTSMPGLDWEQLLRQPFLQSPVRSPADADHYFQRLTLQEMWQAPGVFTRRLARKTLAFWHGREIPRNLDLYGWREPSALLRVTVWHAGIWFPVGVLVPLALAGAVAGRRRREVQLLIAGGVAFGLLVALYFPCSRYRVPVLPLVVLLACGGVQALVAAARDRQWRQACRLAALVMVAGVAANAPLSWPTDRVCYSAHLWYAVGAGAQREGDFDTAQACYEKALQYDPGLADVRCNQGQLFTRLQDTTRAEACYEAALTARPDHDKARVSLAALLTARGQDEHALDQLRLAEAANPLNAAAFRAHADILLRQGRTNEALAPLRRAATFNPDDLILCRALEASQKR
ncbi:MAG: tetratricopeptide repeat protein [Kiritimatiellia bacterium]